MKLLDKIQLIQPGLTKVRGYPQYGSQDVGISPGGPMDLFAMESANRLIGNPVESEILEIIIPPLVEFKVNSLFVLTGGHISCFLEENSGKTKIEHGKVYLAQKGERLKFGSKERGFRTTLAVANSADLKNKSKIGRNRGDFNLVFNWPDVDGAIRIIEGPEYRYLKNSELFYQTKWKISNDTNDMGMRLESDVKLDIEMGNMISDVVSDGTIQLTQNGPIILLKQRQTVGGYPRIYNVISADVDLLAQYMPGQLLKFKKITLQEAENISSIKRDELLKL